jgi:hypothetical protein
MKPILGIEDLRKLVEEINCYLRTHIQLWVQGFTFVLTMNFVALGWFAGEIAQKHLEDYRPLQIVACLFVFMNVIAICVTVGLRKWFAAAQDNLLKLYGSVEQATSADDLARHATRISATGFYRWTLVGGIGATGAVSISWCVLAFLKA